MVTFPNEQLDPGEANAWIHDIEVVRVRTRRDRQLLWFPLVLFGTIILASTPLYALPAIPRGGDATEIGTRSLAAFFPGGTFNASPFRVSVFWLVAGPVCYLAVAGFYWSRARRRGIATAPSAYVLTGVGLFVLLVVTTLVRILPVGDLTYRGLTPLIAVALGLFVLARAEHSWPLVGFAVPFLGLVVAANFYNMANVVNGTSLGLDGVQSNVVVVGVVLVLAGSAFASSGMLARRHSS